MKLLSAVVFLFLVLVVAASFENSTTYENPVVPTKNLPDPGAFWDNGVYYLIMTSMGEQNRFPIYTTTDLVSYQFRGYVWPNGQGQPKWAKTDFWAPEIHLSEDGSTYMLYFTARDLTGRLCIGVAKAASPLGPYTDSGACLVRDPNVGFIDATITDGDDGRRYLVWKEDDNDVGIWTCKIWMQAMERDGMHMDNSSARTLVLTNTFEWEGPIVEAPWVVKRDGWFYVFYSANACWNSSYSVGVARARSVRGPYEKKSTPVLRANAKWAGPGHCSVLPVAAEPSRWIMFYHSWKVPEIGWDYSRLFLQDEIHWDDSTGWPYMATDSPSVDPQPVP